MNNNNLSNLPVKDRDNFLKDLKSLINKYNIDGICNIPDFILVETILDNIYSIEKLQDNLLWWKGEQYEPKPYKNEDSNGLIQNNNKESWKTWENEISSNKYQKGHICTIEGGHYIKYIFSFYAI